MIYELEISEQADNDLRGIFEYIAFELQSPQISCLVIFKEQDTGTVKKLFEALAFCLLLVSCSPVFTL